MVRDDGARLIVVVPRKGPTLRDRWLACRTEGRRGLPRPELLVALKNVARTLDVLNSRNGAPHLALNPETVQLVGGQGLTSDFGLAAWFWLPSGQSLADLNPRYAAPELGANAVSRFCDPYSLAVIFQEMFTGVHPLGPIARPTARAYSQPDLSPLDAADRAVLARALDRTANRRFGSCMELMAALEHGGEASAAAPAAARPSEAAKAGSAASILAEVIADAAGGWQLRKHGLFRYMVQPGERLRHDCVARADRESAPPLLADFCRRWQAELVDVRDDALVYRASRPEDAAGRGQIVVFRDRFTVFTARRAAARRRAHRGAARRLRPGAGEAAARRGRPTTVGRPARRPGAHPDRRKQDRVPFDQPVMVRTVAEDGEPETTIHARARDVSRTGMGLLLPVKPAGRKVIIYLSVADDAPPAPVPSRLVRLQARDEGFEAGALFLGGDD